MIAAEVEKWELEVRRAENPLLESENSLSKRGTSSTRG
jgi:hypothetical protein